MNFREMYDNAASMVNPQNPSKMVSSGKVMAIIESGEENAYYGVSIDASNGLGISAERAAIANMVTCGEFVISKIVIVDEKGNLRLPSGDSRELMMELSPENANTEILMDVENSKMVRLEKLLPLWWGKSEY